MDYHDAGYLQSDSSLEEQCRALVCNIREWTCARSVLFCSCKRVLYNCALLTNDADRNHHGNNIN